MKSELAEVRKQTEGGPIKKVKSILEKASSRINTDENKISDKETRPMKKMT